GYQNLSETADDSLCIFSDGSEALFLLFWLHDLSYLRSPSDPARSTHHTASHTILFLKPRNFCTPPLFSSYAPHSSHTESPAGFGSTDFGFLLCSFGDNGPDGHCTPHVPSQNDTAL